MTTYPFRVLPGTKGSSGATALGLTNIRAKYSPSGSVKTKLLDRLTGTYTDLQRSRMCQTYFDLLDAGLFDVLDAIYIKGTNEADSLINWVSGGNDAINVGATFSQSLGFTTDGSASYVNLNVAFSKLTLSSASIFVHIPDGVTLDPGATVLGRAPGTGGDAAMRIFPESVTAGKASARINTGSSMTGMRASADDMSGLWVATTHLSSGLPAQSLTQKNATIVTTEYANTSTLPTSLTLGSDHTITGVVSSGAFGYGGYLDRDSRQSLSDILDTHMAFMS